MARFRHLYPPVLAFGDKITVDGEFKDGRYTCDNCGERVWKDEDGRRVMAVFTIVRGGVDCWKGWFCPACLVRTLAKLMEVKVEVE